MKTISFEGVVTAVSSIIHNGGEQNGISSMLRREKFVQPDGRAKEVPVISGNAVRGILRDTGMYDMLQKVGYGVQPDGSVQGLPLNAFYFLFSGGSLTSTGEAGVNVDRFRRMKELIPLIGLFGGAIGNAIMPGKLKIGKLIPVCLETLHLLPEKCRGEHVQSIWEYCQSEMYTRKDDEKNDRVRVMIDENVRALLSNGGAKVDLTKAGPQQMMYRVESLAAGTRFYWKIILEDATDIEFEAFVTTLLVFSKAPYLGGRSAVGHGEIAVDFDKWIEIDSRANLEGTEVARPLLQKYFDHLNDNKNSIRECLNQMA